MLLLAGCAAGPTGKPAQTTAAQQVLKAYHVPDLLAQAAPAVSRSLDKNLPDTVSTSDRQRLSRVVSEAFEPQALQQDIVERLRERAAESNHEKELASAADKLSSPLATRMIGLESVAGNENFAQGFNSFVNQTATDARKRRLRLIDGLVADMQVVELQTNYNVILLQSMIRGRNAAVSEQNRVDDAQVERMISNTRQGIRDKLQEQVPLMLLYIYRNVDDADLQQYADLQAKPDMLWTNDALVQAITETLRAAGNDIPEQFNSTL